MHDADLMPESYNYDALSQVEKAGFDESQHPRDDNGRFGSGGGGGGSGGGRRARGGKDSGEGSGSGGALGKTQSGKTVFANASAKDPRYKNFSPQDHLDAHAMHGKVLARESSKTESLSSDKIDAAAARGRSHMDAAQRAVTAPGGGRRTRGAGGAATAGQKEMTSDEHLSASMRHTHLAAEAKAMGNEKGFKEHTATARAHDAAADNMWHNQRAAKQPSAGGKVQSQRNEGVEGRSRTEPLRQGVIGQTSSGKNVFGGKGADHADYNNFSRQDHREAARLHGRVARESGDSAHRTFAGGHRTKAHSPNVLVGKSDNAQADGTMADRVLENLLNVDATILARIDRVTKADDGTDAALDEEAKAALKAAGRILAPHKDRISAGTADALMDAVGLGSDSDEATPDWDEDDDDADEEALEKADDADADDEDDEGVDDGDDDEQELDKSADDDDEQEDDGDDDEEELDKSADDDDDDGDDDEADDGDEDDDAPVRKSARRRFGGAGRLRYSEHVADAGAAAHSHAEDEPVAKSQSLELSGFTPAQRAALEPVLKSQQVQEQALREAVRKANALQHMLDRKEFVSKAKSLPHMGTPEKLGEQMHELYRQSPELYREWVSVLKSANDAMDSSEMFRERGSRLAPKAGAEAQLEQAVGAIVQKSAGAMSHEQAYNAFLNTEEGRALYRRHKDEVLANRGRN